MVTTSQRREAFYGVANSDSIVSKPQFMNFGAVFCSDCWTSSIFDIGTNPDKRNLVPNNCVGNRGLPNTLFYLAFS